jgi:hypothetical protein
MYQLFFWKYNEEIYLNHQEVSESLELQHAVEGLEELPIPVIINRVNTLFLNWERVDKDSWKNSGGNGAFQILTTPQSVRIDCYGTEGKTMDLLVSMMEEFKCPLYDPQVPARYDEMNE